jgi:hypothetical protein
MATNKVYTVVEGLIDFKDSTEPTLTLNNLAAGAGRYSDRYDRGTGAKPSRARIFGNFQLATTGAVGEAIEVYLIEWSSHATPVGDGGVTTTDAALTSDMRQNLGTPALIIIVDTTATNTDMRGSAITEVSGRYVSIGVWNATADNLRATNDSSYVSIEWLAEDIQASA